MRLCYTRSPVTVKKVMISKIALMSLLQPRFTLDINLCVNDSSYHIKLLSSLISSLNKIHLLHEIWKMVEKNARKTIRVIINRSTACICQSFPKLTFVHVSHNQFSLRQFEFPTRSSNKKRFLIVLWEKCLLGALMKKLFLALARWQIIPMEFPQRLIKKQMTQFFINQQLCWRHGLHPKSRHLG